ncbi:MAG: dockerin type I repeat-containing protein, partial [Ruminococcus sp.]|nr:dockerin type I repeat-containing protein [Ruminococcus sp.]
EKSASGELADVYDEDTGAPVKLIPTLERVAERLGLQYGDADSDGYITISDATKIQKHCAELVELSPGQAELADFDRNKTLNISDATEIQFKLADLI